MDFSNYVKKEGRALPVFLLVDTSGSMIGEKIDTVNVAVKEMISTFRKIENPKGVIELCIITFGNGEVKVIKELSKINDNDFYSFVADGNTPMGRAFELVTSMIEDNSVVSARSYTPTIILVSDGYPTDYKNYREGLVVEELLEWDKIQNLHTNGRTSKATKLAIGIGDGADFELLKTFVNNKNIPVIKANETSTIQRFFEWVTMSISVRSVSINPNQVAIGDLYLFNDDEMEF